MFHFKAMSQFLDAVSIGVSEHSAARIAGFSPRTIHHWNKCAEAATAKREAGEHLTPTECELEEYHKALEKARASFEFHHITVLHRASSEDWKASQSALINHYRTRGMFGAIQKTEHTGRDGGPIETKTVEPTPTDAAAAVKRFFGEKVAPAIPSAPGNDTSTNPDNEGGPEAA